MSILSLFFCTTHLLNKKKEMSGVSSFIIKVQYTLALFSLFFYTHTQTFLLLQQNNTIYVHLFPFLNKVENCVFVY